MFNSLGLGLDPVHDIVFHIGARNLPETSGPSQELVCTDTGYTWGY